MTHCLSCCGGLASVLGSCVVLFGLPGCIGGSLGWLVLCSGEAARRTSGLSLAPSLSQDAWSLGRRAFLAFSPVDRLLLSLLALPRAVGVRLRGLSRRISGSGLWLVWLVSLYFPLDLRRSLRRRLGDIGPLSLRLLRGQLLFLTPVLFCGAFPPVSLSPLSLRSLQAECPCSRRGRVLLQHSCPCLLVRRVLRSRRLVSPALVGASRRTMGWLTAS